MSVKGKGTVGYIDTDSDDEYRVIPCLQVITPPGHDRGITEDEPCLGESNVPQDTGDLKFTPVAGSMLFTANEATIENALEACIANDTTFKFAIKLPYATPVYFYMVGKLTKLQPAQVTRDKRISRDFEFLPMAAWTKSTTAPTLES